MDYEILENIINKYYYPYHNVCDIYFVNTNNGEISLEYKYFDKEISSSILQAQRIGIPISRYVNESRKIKIDKIIKNKNYGN